MKKEQEQSSPGLAAHVVVDNVACGGLDLVSNKVYEFFELEYPVL
jgi:hypothetical protein